MNTRAMELTEEMEVKSWSAPAWLKVGFYTVLGALTYQGGLVAYDAASKAYTTLKYRLVVSVIEEELNKQTGDLTPAQIRMKLYEELKHNQSCQATMNSINVMSNNIEVVRK